jgi:prolyl-tRNA editing enzyme YbaK/EbsC (Cys-tRNA(Pro) deacylase)
VAEALRQRGVEGPFLEFDASTKTAAEAARALECDVGAIASCLVFVLDDAPVVIIKSGAFRVDTALFASSSTTHWRTSIESGRPAARRTRSSPRRSPNCKL